MSGKVLEIEQLINRDNLARDISFWWDSWNQQRATWKAEKKELRDYVFATDTTKTTNSQLDWKNKTTIPKICQIRDNLHANYMAALFPNDDWLKWEGYDKTSETKEKRQIITAYMSNKLRESGFRTTVSKLVYDFIDGNAFADTEFVSETVPDELTGEEVAGYVGPKLLRVNPMDHVFNPTAVEYKVSPKITRYLKTVGELKAEILDRPELQYYKEILDYIDNVRDTAGTYQVDDFEKASGYSIDGFGNLQEYYQSAYVEILEFEGDIHDKDTDTLLKNQIITVIDRAKVIRKEVNPTWYGRSSKVHVGWRERPDNLYAMGPLDNLVGMQYRIDHLENAKADAYDQIIQPPLKIKGNVEAFDWGPGVEINVGDDGDVLPLRPDTTMLNADTQIVILEGKMEEMAGAPKQAMGIRTPGEKTAFEVQSLENAAGRIFQDKITQFEVELIEPILNNMLEQARRNMEATDIIRVIDNDLGVATFMEITKEDITAKGKLRPVGARHFSARAQLIQNLTGIFNSGLANIVIPHTKSFDLTQLIEDAMGLSRFGIFEQDAQVYEQTDRQKLMNSAQQEVEMDATTDTDLSPEDVLSETDLAEGEV